MVRIIGIMKKLILLLLAVVFFAACEDTNYLSYSSKNNGIYFHHDTLVYSFAVTPIETTSYTLNVPVKIMGTTSSEPRAFSYVIETQMPSDDVLKNIYVPKSSSYVWASKDVEYSVPQQGIIEANAIESYIPITIDRTKLEGDYASGYKHYRFILRLVGNENFVPSLSESDQVRIIEFDNAVEQPAWYDAYGEKVWYESRYGVWHPLKFIKMVEYFHTIADIQPETYKDMVVAYGENLEHIPLGSDYQYRTIFRKYVYTPMYEYFNTHHDEILAMYPDFPFDFPEPYSW